MVIRTDQVPNWGIDRTGARPYFLLVVLFIALARRTRRAATSGGRVASSV